MTDEESRAVVLEDLARAAIAGDWNALDQLVRELQDDVYALSLRMLCNREDAEDATQEILIRIVTHLPQFKFSSKLKTWSYRVAVNYILDVKKSAVERRHLSFELLAEHLTTGLNLQAPSESEQSLLVEEVKIGCTFGMLQCLDRPHRSAYILGEIIELPGPEAAEVLGISPELLRKRLQHARVAILSFTKKYCGLASDSAQCKCNRQVPNAIRLGKMNGVTCNFVEGTVRRSGERVRILPEEPNVFNGLDPFLTRFCPLFFNTCGEFCGYPVSACCAGVGSGELFCSSSRLGVAVCFGTIDWSAARFASMRIWL